MLFIAVVVKSNIWLLKNDGVRLRILEALYLGKAYGQNLLPKMNPRKVVLALIFAYIVQ